MASTTSKPTATNIAAPKSPSPDPIAGEYHTRLCNVKEKTYTIAANISVYKDEELACCTRVECDLYLHDKEWKQYDLGRAVGYTVDKTVRSGRSQRIAPLWVRTILKAADDHYQGDMTKHAKKGDKMTDMQKMFQLLFERVKQRPKEELGEDFFNLLNSKRLHYIEYFCLQEDFRGKGFSKDAMLTYLDGIDQMANDERYQGAVLLSPAPLADETEKMLAAGYKIKDYVETVRDIMSSYSKAEFERLFDEYLEVHNGITIMIRTTSQVMDEDVEMSDIDDLISRAGSVAISERSTRTDDLEVGVEHLEESESELLQEALGSVRAFSEGDDDEMTLRGDSEDIDVDDEDESFTPRAARPQDSLRSSAYNADDELSASEDQQNVFIFDRDQESGNTRRSSHPAQHESAKGMRPPKQLGGVLRLGSHNTVEAPLKIRQPSQSRTKVPSLTEDVVTDVQISYEVGPGRPRKYPTPHPPFENLLQSTSPHSLGGQEAADSENEDDELQSTTTESEIERFKKLIAARYPVANAKTPPRPRPTIASCQGAGAAASTRRTRRISRRELIDLREFNNDPNPERGIWNRDDYESYYWHGRWYLLDSDTQDDWVQGQLVQVFRDGKMVHKALFEAFLSDE